MLTDIIKNEIRVFLIENELEYRGEHSAPSPDSDDAPMHDLTDIYPDNIYANDAARHYPHYSDNRDYEAINIMQSVRNKPRAQVKIYRAVPDINYEVNQKIKELYSIIIHYNKFGFFPLKNQIIYGLQDKYSNDKYGYDEQQKLIYSDIQEQIEALQSQNQKSIGINNGDWVTISKNYAKEHGESNLNNQFKIISKTVPARHLFTDANDIFEWGYYVN